MADAAIVEIAEYHDDVLSSLKLFFSEKLRVLTADFRNRDAIANLLTLRPQETDQRSAFFILASLEAAFRIDYERRCQKRMKDDVSRAFRAIYNSRKSRVSLDDDIFEAWRKNSTGSGPLIGELRAAFKFRHWLAHGRYWEPKLGRKYDFNSVYSLADAVLNAFPFQTFD
jgi:hypothetical protein